MATEKSTGKSPVIISNKVFQQPQDCTEIFKETTGEIIYANDFAGIGSVPMPTDYKLALNSDFGEVGNNLIIQLQQKVQQFPDGPWYVDSIDGVIHIHNKKLQEPSRATYTYQSEDGELLSASFETQYVKKGLRGSTSTGLDMDKNFSSEGLAIHPLLNQNTSSDYLVNGKYNIESLLRDYELGKTTYNQVMLIDQRIKDQGNKSAYTDGQWKKIRQIRHNEIERDRQLKQSDLNQRYEAYQSQGIKAEELYKQEAVSETLRTKDLTTNVTEYLVGIYGSPEDASKVQQELDAAAKNGTLDELLKRRFSDVDYTFSDKHPKDWTGAKVEAYGTFKLSPVGGKIDTKDIDKNPNLVRLSTVQNDGKVKVFGKKVLTTRVSGYRLLKAHYSRKYGGSIDGSLSRRVLAVANQSKSITEKKLNAKVTVVGRPSLATSQIITLNNLGKKWSGQWYIKTCIHNMDPNSGYTTQMDLVKHNGVEGHTSSVQSNGHTITSDQNQGGNINSKPKSIINLTTLESNYYSTHSDIRKEDLLILKMAGVQDAVLPVKGTAIKPLSEGNKIAYQLVRKPTIEERKKYGRAAAKAVENNKPPQKID